MKIKNIGKGLALGLLLNTVPLIANAQEPKIEKPKEGKDIIVSVNAGYFFPKDLVNTVYGSDFSYGLEFGYNKNILSFLVKAEYWKTTGNFKSTFERKFLFFKETTARSSEINTKSIEPGIYLSPRIDEKNELLIGGGPLAGILEEILFFEKKGFSEGERTIDKENKVFFGLHGKLGIKHKIGKNSYLKGELGISDSKVKDFPDIKLGGYKISGGIETRF